MAAALTVVADAGTFLAALANLFLVYVALRNLRALKDQIRVGQSAAVAARKSADAAGDAVREAAQTRIDEQAPRVVVLMEEPKWPPYLDRRRRAMSGGGEPTLSEIAGAGPYYFDEQKSWFLWFWARGVLINEGHGTARVRLDGSARFIEGQSQLSEATVSSRSRPSSAPISPRSTFCVPMTWRCSSGDTATPLVSGLTPKRTHGRPTPMGPAS